MPSEMPNFLEEAVRQYWRGYLNMETLPQYEAELAILMKRHVPHNARGWINRRAKELEQQWKDANV